MLHRRAVLGLSLLAAGGAGMRVKTIEVG